MWERFKRAMRSIFGAGISKLEDPERILEQNIRDLNDQVPKMNESIAMVRANVTLLERENSQYENQLNALRSKIKAAIQSNRDDIAQTYALQLQAAQEALERNTQQLDSARAAHEKALNVKQAFIREKERKTREATEALNEARRARWQSQVADAMSSFKVAGVDATHDEMVRRVNEKSAVDQARLEMALDNIDIQGLKIEEDAEKLRANELVQQFKMEMGLQDPPVSASELPSAEKTIGKKTDVKA